MTERADPGPPGRSEPGRRRIRRPSPAAWLALAVAVYFAVSFALSWLRAVELQTTTWDLGIFQQALWSTAHGRPFYEAADLETGGFHSLLEVHTVGLLYLIVPLYALLPTEATLFAVQSAVVALAAVPLYLLARDVTRSSWLALAAAVVFLAWAPTLSSNLYDFHAEAFLPVEIFTVVLLWQRARYAAGFTVVAVACATFELAPVLLFFVGAFFLIPSATTWRRWRGMLSGPTAVAAVVADLRRALALPRVRASVALLVACTVVYLLLVYLRTDVLLAVLGRSPLAVAPTGYVIGATPSSLGLAVANLGVGFFAKVEYWILVVALLGFVPFLAPRALVLSLPWFVFTMLSADLNYVTLGFQYGFVAAVSLLPAFAYGLGTLERRGFFGRTVAGPSAPGAGSAGPPGRPGRSVRPSSLAVAGLTVLVAVNIALSPVNPLMQNQGLGAGYRVSYGGTGGFAGAEALVQLIPAGATVVASDDLFPLVANDEHAYSFFWTQNNFLALPFSAADLPPYVLIAESRIDAVPAWLAGELYNTSVYGVRGVDWSSGAGALLLFEAGYRGAAEAFGPGPSLPLSDAGANLANADAGYPASAPGAPGPGVAASAPGVLGTFFEGPGGDLPAGNVSVTLLLRASSIAGAPAVPGATPVLWVGASAFAQPALLDQEYPLDALDGPAWTAVTFPLTLPGPTIQFIVQGVTLDVDVEVELEEVEVVADGPAAAGAPA